MGFVQSKAGAYATLADLSTIAFNSNVVAGNAIIVMGRHSYAGCPPSITDSQSNTYTAKGTRPSTGGNTRFEIFTAVAGSSGALTITTSMACGSFISFIMIEVSGLISDPYDVQNVHNSNTTSPADCGSITPSQNGEYTAALFDRTGGVTSTYTARSGFTLRDTSVQSQGYEDLIQATAAAITPDIDCTVDATYPVSGVTAAFKMTATAVVGSLGDFDPELRLSAWF